MNSDNPYAAPDVHPTEPGAVRWHHDFELTPRGIRCRSGLELPAACLVTGERTDLVVTNIVLRAVQPWLVTVIWWGIAGMVVFAVFSVVLVFRMAILTVNSPVMIFLFVGLPFLAALMVVFGYSRLSALIHLKAYHSQRVRKWRWVMNILGLFPAVAILLLRFMHLQVGFVMITLAGVYLILAVFVGKKLEGMRPVVRWVSDDLFEVSGFSKPFRNVLEQQAATVANTATAPNIGGMASQ
jgi:hypothetical protein